MPIEDNRIMTDADRYLFRRAAPDRRRMGGLSSAGLPGMLSEFSGNPPSIRITEPATPIPVTGRTPFLGHGFLGPFDYGPFEGFPDGIARRLAKYANKDHQGSRLYRKTSEIIGLGDWIRLIHRVH